MVDSPERKLDELVEGMKIAMMTTRRKDGHLVSRPMALQKKEKKSFGLRVPVAARDTVTVSIGSAGGGWGVIAGRRRRRHVLRCRR